MSQSTGVEICQAVSDVFTLAVSVPIGLSVVREMQNGNNK